MEAFGLYLIKSVIWLSGFTLVFILFLRNERFFLLNRIFLLSGILSSFMFPFITISYTVYLPLPGNIQVGDIVSSGISDSGGRFVPNTGTILLFLYVAGALFVSYMIIKQGKSVIRAIKKAEIVRAHPVKLIRTAEYTSSFSFFSYVFVNPSVTDIETEEIMNHELVHIRQMHWIDLVLVELLCVLQWFNPFIWIYIRFIRQNHEYLADEVALQRTADPAIYRATLLNQIVGTPVVSLANSFNYSLNKKRFNMMKNIINSPYRKMKIFLIIPVIAIVLYAFAKPEYRYTSGNVDSAKAGSLQLAQEKIVKGQVVRQGGEPLPGATVSVIGTTLGTVTDQKGYFTLEKTPSDGSLVVTFVGFKSKVVKPDFKTEMKISLVVDTLNLGIAIAPPPPPPPPPASTGKVMLGSATSGDVVPPPPPPPFQIKGNGPPPLIILDGKMVDIDLEKIDPQTIESISVLKDKAATDLYGEKGKNGVIIVTTKNKDLIAVKEKGSNQSKDLFVVVEEMPQFIEGGEQGMMKWIAERIKYPAEAVKKNITGEVMVKFMVTGTGKVKDVTVVKSVHPLLDAEAIRLVNSMPDWKPGMQAGKPVDVYFKLPVVFSLDKVK
jgi:TonB family protein